MKKKIYSALIGIGLVSLTLGIWGGVTMYKNLQATELIIQARNEERQKAEAESQTVMKKNRNCSGAKRRIDSRSKRSESGAYLSPGSVDL